MKQHHKHAPRLLSLALAAILTCAMLPTAAVAQGAAPRAAGDNQIVVSGVAPYTLDWAGMNSALLDVAEGGTVQLGGDITLTSGLTVRKSCTFDLNGHTITLNRGPDLLATGLLNSRNLSLTIKDTAGNGQMRAIGANFAIILWENSSLTVNGGSLSGETQAVRVLSNSTIIINGGTLSARGTAIIAAPSTTVIINGGSLSGDTSAIRANTHATVTINGGSLTSPSGRTVHMNTTDPSTFTMTGGTVSTQTGEALHLNGYCTSNLSGGTVEATASDGVAIFSRASNNKISLSGGALVTSVNTATGTIVYDASSPPRGVFLEVQGGTVSNSAAPEGYSLYFHPTSQVTPTNVLNFYAVSAPGQLGQIFPQAAYIVEAGAGPGGSISPSGSVSVAPNASQTFTITPASGYSIAAVTVDGVDRGSISTYTFSNVTESHTIVAAFRNTAIPGVNTITASAGSGGSISPSGAIEVSDHADQTFTITPDSGYSIASVLVDGVSMGPISSHIFSGVTAEHSISASFRRNASAPSTGFSSNANADEIYPLLEGANGTWRVGEPGLSVLVNAPYQEFYSVEVNHTSIPKDCYTTQAGSTRVTLEPDYLATLPLGSYSLRVVFTDGFAATDFTVAPAAAPVPAPTPTPAPATGDVGFPAATGWALLLLAGAASAALACRKNRQGNRK